MTQQYIRKAGLLIGEGSQALDLSEMQFTFSVQASTLETPKTAQLRVYNLSQDTARKVTKEGSQLLLSAGYEGNFNTIFNGQLTQARIGRENGTDTYLDITAADGDYVYNGGFVNASVLAGSDVIGRIGQIANAAGIKLGTIQAPTNGAKLHRGVVFFGLARDHLRTQCATIGANWCINNGELDVIVEGGYKPGDIPVITAATGMLGVPEQTDLGIYFKCLLNPNIQQNMLVQLDNKSIQQLGFSPIRPDVNSLLQNGITPPLAADGIYKVLYVNHYGDTRGNDWVSEVVAYSKLVAKSGQLDYMPEDYKPQLY
jgi:hypothetical protein